MYVVAETPHFDKPSSGFHRESYTWSVPPLDGMLAPGRRATQRQLSASEKEDNAPTNYQWRGLIWQSVLFNVSENAFRVEQDYVMRDLLAHKPFWHDWLASMHQWNMHRWSDGDDFLVDDVGHPIQGAVSAFIEIQNSPTDSRIEWGDQGYVMSRFKGFLWATVFSTHEKISPAGEAGMGNDGGFTYGNQCHYLCNSSNFGAGTSDTKYTNNTGWTDFIITPTVGMLWVLAEDVLDKDISDRLVLAHPEKMWPKYVRGGLNPSRSFANIMRWHAPWYRDYEQSPVVPPRVHWFQSDDEIADRAVPRFQFSPYFTGLTIAANTPACFNCRETAMGAGMEQTTNIRGWLGFDSAVSYHPNASPLPSDRAGGDMLVAVFGLGATREWHNYGLHLGLRPGLVRFNNAYETSPVSFAVPVYPTNVGTTAVAPATSPEPGVIDATGTALEPKLGDINHFVWDVNLTADYKLSRAMAIRVGINEDVVRYRTDKVTPPGLGAAPYYSWLSKENFINRGTQSFQLGPVFSF
jgi:hypothetical protein